MGDDERWYFTKEKLENTPTRKCGVEASKELSYRQQAANFIQDMGQRLQVTQLCINTAIVYMHRFYMFHSFTKQHRNQLAVAALFLAAKVEEQPRKLEHVVRVAHKCLHRGEDIDPKSEVFMNKCNELVFNENVMLQTLGFDIAIDHPHTYVVKLLQLVKATKDLAQTSYFMATNSLHLTTMCLQYKPTVVACVCIHLACKWSDWKIEPCSEGKEWHYYVDKGVTQELLEELTKDFLAVLEKSPNRLKHRVGSTDNNKDGQSQPFKPGDELIAYDNIIELPKKDIMSLSGQMNQVKTEKLDAPSTSNVPDGIQLPVPAKKPKTEAQHSISLAVYREKREKERHAEPKPPIAVPKELPLPIITRPPDKHTVAAGKEKPIPKPEPLSNEHVPQKMQLEAETNSKQHSLNCVVESSTSNETINHQVKRVPPPLPAPKSKNVFTNKNDLVRNSSPTKNKGGSPFVLLTRLNELPAASKKTGDRTVPPNAQSVKVKTVPSPRLSLPTSTHVCDTSKQGPKVPDASAHPTSKPIKHPKPKVPTLQNSRTTDVPHFLPPQGNLPKQNPTWDVGQANGSNVFNPTTAESLVTAHLQTPPPPLLSSHKVAASEKTDGRSKSEKREKHKHKHSVHSSKEKVSNKNHVSESEPPVPSSIKITIPKEKIVLSANATQDHEPSLKSLKIKIPMPKASEPPIAKANSSQGTGLKLVITKDKNAGSYSSSTRKAEKASRKRDRSPSSKEHSSRSSTKQAKSNNPSHQVNRIPAAKEVDGRNCVVRNASSHPMEAKVHRQNNAGQNAYVMQQPPYLNQLYYNPQTYNYSMPNSNMQYGHPFPPPGTGPPPLPRDPPPPLPPRPPMPSE